MQYDYNKIWDSETGGSNTHGNIEWNLKQKTSPGSDKALPKAK